MTSMYIHSCRCRVWFTTLGTDRVTHLDPTTAWDTTAWGTTALVHSNSQVVPNSACDPVSGCTEEVSAQYTNIVVAPSSPVSGDAEQYAGSGGAVTGEMRGP